MAMFSISYLIVTYMYCNNTSYNQRFRFNLSTVYVHNTSVRKLYLCLYQRHSPSLVFAKLFRFRIEIRLKFQNSSHHLFKKT